MIRCIGGEYPLQSNGRIGHLNESGKIEKFLLGQICGILKKLRQTLHDTFLRDNKYLNVTCDHISAIQECGETVANSSQEFIAYYNYKTFCTMQKYVFSSLNKQGTLTFTSRHLVYHLHETGTQYTCVIPEQLTYGWSGFFSQKRRRPQKTEGSQFGRDLLLPICAFWSREHITTLICL